MPLSPSFVRFLFALLLLGGVCFAEESVSERVVVHIFNSDLRVLSIDSKKVMAQLTLLKGESRYDVSSGEHTFDLQLEETRRGTTTTRVARFPQILRVHVRLEAGKEYMIDYDYDKENWEAWFWELSRKKDGTIVLEKELP